MKWEASITQHDHHYSQPIEALRGSCMIIQRDVSGAWQGLIPIGEALVVLQAETADDAKHEAEDILRKRLRRALAEVASTDQGPMSPSPTELIDALFSDVIEGEIIAVDSEQSARMAELGLRTLASRQGLRFNSEAPKPTHVVIDHEDGQVVGSGRSAAAAKVDAIGRAYIEARRDVVKLRARIAALRDAAKELFDL